MWTAEQGREHDHQQTHVVEERQPADAGGCPSPGPTAMIICTTLVHTARWVISTPAGRAGRARGVLQIGDTVAAAAGAGTNVGTRPNRAPRRPRSPAAGGPAAACAGTSATASAAAVGGQDRRRAWRRRAPRPAARRGRAAPGRTAAPRWCRPGWRRRRRRRSRGPAGQDRHPVTGRGDLLQAGADRPQPDAQLLPGQFDRAAVGSCSKSR